MAMASSIDSAVVGWRLAVGGDNNFTSVACRMGGGVDWDSCVRMETASGPSMRTMARALRPGGVAGATMVSIGITAGRRFRLGRFGCGGTADDGHAFEEALAARLGGHVGVVAQRDVH